MCGLLSQASEIYKYFCIRTLPVFILLIFTIYVKCILCIINMIHIVIESIEFELKPILNILCALATVRTTKCRPLCTAQFSFWNLQSAEI